jgi:hypothetical protein
MSSPWLASRRTFSAAPEVPARSVAGDRNHLQTSNRAVDFRFEIEA